jgi:hypothetical protein
MPPIYLVKFWQMPGFNSTTHWGIYMVDESKGYDHNGVPRGGVLHHASKNPNFCFCCSGDSNATTYSTTNYVFQISRRHYTPVLLQGVNINESQLVFACNAVSEERPFNLINRNCQQWVQEVMEKLILAGDVPQNVLDQMREAGFIPLIERSQQNPVSSVCFSSFNFCFN